jgi:hypothetical protein
LVDSTSYFGATEMPVACSNRVKCGDREFAIERCVDDHLIRRRPPTPAADKSATEEPARHRKQPSPTRELGGEVERVVDGATVVDRADFLGRREVDGTGAARGGERPVDRDGGRGMLATPEKNAVLAIVRLTRRALPPNFRRPQRSVTLILEELGRVWLDLFIGAIDREVKIRTVG